jgi:glycosyltransferase involved in cell wall biosynthesis
MTNVLSVIHFPVFGGPGVCNALVANALAPRGFRTHIVVPDEPGNQVQRFGDYGISVTQLPLHRVRALKNPAVHARYLASMRREIDGLRRFIRDNDIDVVVINGAHNPHGALAAQREGRAVVWKIEDTFPPPIFLRAMMPVILRVSDVLMTNGMSTAAVHPGAMEFEGPLLMSGPPVPVERFTADASVAAAARAELGFAPDDVVVGTVNNINPMKGHLTFVRAAAALRRAQPAKFVILGAVNSEDYRREVLAEADRLGLQLDKDLVIREAGSRVHELAQAMDLFWLTSEPRAEGMSNTLAEAQALGIPVIATRSGAVHENLRDGVTGFLLPPHDIDGIVRQSRRLLDDRALYEQFSAAAAQHIRQNFTAEITAEQHYEAYEAALEIRARKNRT